MVRSPCMPNSLESLFVAQPARALRIDLRQPNDRIRFVVLGRIGAAREAEARDGGSSYTFGALARRLGRAPGALTTALDHLELSTSGPDGSWDLLEALCDQLGDRVALNFAARAMERHPRTVWELDSEASWWPELRNQPFTPPIVALVAARVLEGQLGLLTGDDTVTNTSAFAFPSPVARDDRGEPPPPRLGADGLPAEEWFARRRLARALLDIATSGSGHAHDAQVMLERLAPAFVAELSEFLHRAPRWMSATHVVDRALRSPFPASARQPLLDMATDFLTSGDYVRRLRERPPRAAASLRLARRVGFETTGATALAVAEVIASIAGDPQCPLRGRRYSLWVLAELDVAHGTPEVHEVMRAALDEARSCEHRADVVHMLEHHAGGYAAWAERYGHGPGGSEFGDPFDIDLWNDDGQIAWPLPERAAAMLRRELGAADEAALYAAPWDRVPRRLVPAARRLTLELLLHPGLVRTKAAADTIIHAGPSITGAVARVTSSLLRSHLETGVLPGHVVEGALATLGYLRHDAALELLCDAGSAGAQAVLGEDGRAAAVASLGDVMVAAGRRLDAGRLPKHWHRGQSVLGAAIADPSPYVVQAAIRGVAGLRADHFVAEVRAARTRFDDATLPVQLAEWCLAAWDPAQS